MTEAEFDVLGIGNAIVDVMARTEEDFLVARAAREGHDAPDRRGRAEALYGAHGPGDRGLGRLGRQHRRGVASLGGRAAFIGKVADDPLGAFYRHDMQAAGVHFATAPLVDGAPTARSMILITPDGERTMNTYLGACQALGPGRHRPRRRAGGGDHLPRRLPVGSAGGEEGVPRAPPRSPTRPAARCR